MRKMKRALALLLVFAMTVSFLPSYAFAAESELVDAVVFGSDIHDGPSTAQSIMASVKESGLKYSTATFVGDTFSDSAGTKATVTEYIQNGLGDTSVECLYAWGDHDYRSDIDNFTGLLYGAGADETIGTSDDANYYIYTISMSAMTDMGDSKTGLSSTYSSDLLTAFTGAVEKMDKSKPLFIATHMPLHARRGDNDYAYNWYQVIEAAANQMDVVVFWAHNHTGDTGSNYDSTCYFLTAGSEIEIEGAEETQTLNFTYANAGYINPPNGSGRKNVATSVAIYDDSMKFVVYDANGVYSSNTYATGGTVTRKFAVQEATLSSIAITTAPTKTTYNVGDTLDTTGMVVTATYSDTTTDTVTDYTVSDVDMTTAGTKTVTVTYSGKTTSFEIIVNDKEVSYILVDESTDAYTVGDELYAVIGVYYTDGTNAKVSLDACTVTPSCTACGCTTLEQVMNTVAVSESGYHQVTITYGGKSKDFLFTVDAADNHKDETTGIVVSVADHVSANGTIATHTGEVTINGASNTVLGYKAYDIKPADDCDLKTGNYATITFPIPEGYSNPKVYCVDTNEWFDDIDDSDSTITVRTSHFSTWAVVDLDTEAETGSVEKYATGTTTTTTKTVYVLSSGNPSGTVLIANSATAGSVNLLANDGGDPSNTTATVVYGDCDGDGDSEYYIELTDTEATNSLWTVAGSYTFENQDEYLRYNSGLSISSQSTTWSYSNNRLSCRSSSGSSSNRYLRYNNGWTTTNESNRATSIYFYVPTTITETTDNTVTGTVSLDAGDDITKVIDTTATNTVTINPTILFNDAQFSGDLGGSYTYSVVSDANGILSNATVTDGVFTLTGEYGTATVRVYYTWTVGETTYKIWDTVDITATEPYYTIDLHLAEYSYTEVDITAFEEGTTYYVQNEDGSYSEVASDATFDADTTYYVLGSVTVGDEITAPVALKGVEAGDTYSVWAVIMEYNSKYPNGNDLGDVEDARIYWTVSDANIATVDPHTGVITFTGTNYGTITVTAYYLDEDGDVLCEDTITISVTESLYVVPGDGTNDFPEYPNEGAVRFDKTATAVGNYSETGIALVELSMTGVPYSTGNAIDALLVLDMSTSMETSVGTDDDGNSVTRYDVTADATKAFVKTIVQNDDGTYNTNTVAIQYFNGTTAYTLTEYITISSDTELEALNAKIDALMADPPSTSGTDYSTSMKTAYDTIIARDAVSDNTQALVFMSDGGPTYYTYVNGDSYGTLSDAASTIVGWFDTDDNDTTDETDDTATPNSSFKNEYYSTLLKDAGYPVYTVGLGLSSNDTGPQAFTKLTSGAHEAITGYILSSMATSNSYFYNVADSDAVANMGNIFSGIAASIKEAATDVVVEDKIGDYYSMNFSLPTGITSDATDGLSEFYIQVVDYVLDSTTHERTGVYTVLENFTFNADGTLKSHTVDGVDCSSCTHVTTTNGVITEIVGNYFTYKNITDESKEDYGEYLTWEVEKITSTELCLQYFAYLDNSAGTNVQNQIPAGTYYTNEYATLTYTNYNGTEVQNEFPVPQMTWNGAQVSYTFYLVNAAGQPVNRAGRVVPFAEAVYVTDVFTYSVIWNDLEQAAGLEAKYLAKELVPDVYALYDDDASYNIHVYEKETEVNLNNHFVINGDVTDDYNTTTNSWTNANTTYVFNNKSDTTKYYTVGTYVSDDGDATANESNLSYFCKSAIIEDATWTSKVENDVTVYTVTSVGNGYQKVDGEAQATVAQIEATGGSTTGGTIIGDYIYYVDENGDVYTIVQKSDGAEVEKGFDFSNTTVAFAVVWKPELKEDTVVIDYGLDVVIDVVKNDTMATTAVGVRADAPSGITINSGTYEATKATKVDVEIDGMKIGTASIIDGNNTSVRFSLDKDNGMQFNQPAVFYYESDVNYYKSGETTLTTTSMYSSVTVIPATTVYYEDEYVTLTTETKGDSGWTTDETSTWTHDGTTVSATQDVDRPGVSKISEAYDADNVYGFDSAYAEMSKYSLGSSAKVNVYSGHRAKASFDFYGTGFDIISLTDNTTGTITVKVTDVGGAAVKSLVVDTYYGYAYNSETKEWTVTTNDPNALYQVPVMKVEGLTYGKYHVEITAAWASLFDHTSTTGNYDFYLDAIRIYDPTGVAAGEVENKTVSDTYVADGEGWPVYEELRNNVIKADSFVYNGEGYTTYAEVDIEEFEDGVTYYTKNGDDIYTKVTGEYSGETTYYVVDTLYGVVFIDCSDANTSIDDYTNYGPNNELYLAKDQAIAFNVGVGDTVADVQLGIKVGNGDTVTYEINGDSYTVNSATDMYYSILEYAKAGTITIKNVSGGILSLTNIKVTHSSAPATESGISLLSMDSESVGFALMRLRSVAVEEEDATPDTDTEVEEDVTEPEEDTSADVEEDATTDVETPEDTETTEPEEDTSADVEEDTATDVETPEDTETTEPEEDASADEGEDASDEEVTQPDEDETTEEESIVDTIVEAVTNIVNTVVNTLKNFFGKWFR